MLLTARANEEVKEQKGSVDWVMSFSAVSFQCPVNCDACCRRSLGPSLTVKDYKIIKQNLPYSNFADKRAHPLFPYQLKAREDACIFLNRKGKCSIYPYRPFLCRLYPLQLHFQWDGKLLWCLEHCPGVGVENGTYFSESYLENLLWELLEIEGETFFNDLREYVLKTKQFLTPLFEIDRGMVYSDWQTKNRMKDIVWEMFHAESLERLTPRGRLECIVQDLLPALEQMIMRKAVQLPGENKFLVGKHILREAYKQYQGILPVLSSESAARERIHLEDLKKKGNIVYGAESGATIRYHQPSRITIHGFYGRKIEVNTAELMHIPKITAKASLIEGRYLNEFQRREGRFGKESTDLTINSEVRLMFLAADALELKANAFTIEKGKEMIGTEEINEAIWIVERNLSWLLESIRK